MALKDRAEALGWTVPERFVFQDDGWSGPRLDRPALDALRDAAADRLLEAVLVYDPDRLARSYVHQQLLLYKLEKRGVASLPLYPEGRADRAPTANLVLGAFEALQLHRLYDADRLLRVFLPELSPVQEEILDLVGVPSADVTGST